MKVVIVGGGMVGMTLAHLLRKRGVEPTVVERAPAGHYIPRGYMLGFQGYEALQEIGIFDEVRDAGRAIAPRPDHGPVAVAVRFGALIEALQRDLPMVNDTTVTELLRDDDGRVVGVAAEGPDGPVTFESDLVVACDGAGSPTRAKAGLEAEIDPLPEASLSFMSPSVADTSFAMAYMSDGGHIGMLSWAEGSAGWRSCERVGAEAALAPGLDAIKEMWARLLPPSASAIEGVTSLDQIRYSEPALLRCPRWWTPGVVVIGDAAHFFGPETGISSAIGLGDAEALTQAILQYPDDPDAACRSYETWRAPVVRPYEANDPGRHRMLVADTRRPLPDERWPPEDGAA
ncbi:FAD-dependent monooxygenase [Miltoncostaea marina]|uniref:FAD-dependent monooxygenase n=1 Tax=Miltoncostaea marina TaxID=2843215 RepID=UPI001C3D6EE0|nr:FAD-dependent monooxygenase [Miltoncostaea marina]